MTPSYTDKDGVEHIYTYRLERGGSFKDETEYRDYLQTLTKRLEEGTLRILDPGFGAHTWILLEADKARTGAFDKIYRARVAEDARDFGLENEDGDEKGCDSQVEKPAIKELVKETTAPTPTSPPAPKKSVFLPLWGPRC
jgi:hypothetical protein